MKMPHHTPQTFIIMHDNSKAEAVKPRKRTGTASCMSSHGNRTVLLHVNRLSLFVHILPQAHASFVPLEYYRTVPLYHGWTVKHAED